MIEQINDNVFRVKRTDLTHRPEELMSEINDAVRSHCSILIARKREDANINGSRKLIENIENDYRSHAFIIVHKNRSFPVTYNHHEFEIILDRYDRIDSVLEPEHGIEMLTAYTVYPDILRAYMRAYGVMVDYKDGFKVIPRA